MSYHKLIPIHIDEAVRWYHSGIVPLQEIALRAFSKEEIERSEHDLAEMTFFRLRDLRNEVRNGWVPDWTDDVYKYCIINEKNVLAIVQLRSTSQFLSFETEEQARAFLANHYNSILEVKDLI